MENKTILVIGSGGREFSIVDGLCRDSTINSVICSPGSDGIAAIDPRVEIVTDDSFESLVNIGKRRNPDLAVVGPEKYLVKGLVDTFTNFGLPIVGPTQKQAMLEGSKAWMKWLLTKYRIPTAPYAVFTDFNDAQRHIQDRDPSMVVKADGLCGGKGVVVTDTATEASDAIDRMMVKREFGDAGDMVVIENRLIGTELSLIFLTDGTSILPLPPTRDYKSQLNGGEGPNTGGMGSVSADELCDRALSKIVEETIIYPLLRAMRDEGIGYQGFLYAGLMITSEGPQVLEFNVRGGDTETQTIRARLKSPLYPILHATATGTLGSLPPPSWNEEPAVCLVLADPDYPVKYTAGQLIEGIENVPPDVQVLHAGTKESGGKWYTNGGRILNLMTLGSNANLRLRQAAMHITYGGLAPRYRTDIG